MLTMYAVRNGQGGYFRNKGYGGYGETWMKGLDKARIYPRPGPARAIVTFFATSYPEFGVPELVELRVTEVIAVDETDRVRKSLDRKAKADAAYEERRARREQEAATRKLNEAKEELARLRMVGKEAERRKKDRRVH